MTMPMKRKIDKAAWEKLAADVQSLYKLVGSDYVLELEDDEDDDGGTKASEKLRIERQHRRNAEKAAKEAQDKLDELTDAANKKNNDIAAVEASWKKKYEKLEGDKKADADKFQAVHRKSLVDNVAAQLATKLSSSPKLLIPHLKSRLDVDFEGDEPQTVVLGADGKRSALTLDELAKEFRDNKDFSSIIIASQASGGGASRPGATNGNGGALLTGKQSDQKPTLLSSLKGSELVAHIKAVQAEKAT